jgi:hypothetical protein
MCDLNHSHLLGDPELLVAAVHLGHVFCGCAFGERGIDRRGLLSEVREFCTQLLGSDGNVPHEALQVGPLAKHVSVPPHG